MDTLLTTDPAAPRRVDPSVDNSLVRFDGIVGHQQGTGIIVDDSNNVTGVVGLTATGTATLATVDINAGAIDGTTIGATTASSVKATSIDATGTATLATVDINAGAIDGTTIGATTASSVKATTINATGATTLTTADLTGAATVDTINEHTADAGVTVEGILVKDATVSGGFNKLNSAFAGIHVHDASAAQSIATGATYTKLTCFTDDDVDYQATSDAANDKITITVPGVYKVDSTFSFTLNTNNVVMFCAPFFGGVESDSIHFKTKIATGADVNSATFSGLINISTVPVDIDARVRHDYGSAVDITVAYANMSTIRVGDAQ